MPATKRKHLDLEDRVVIEEGLRDGLTARAASRRLHVSASTVTREVKANREVRTPYRKGAKPSASCASYKDCQRGGSACPDCTARLTTCKHCKTKSCIDHCEGFVLAMCAKTLKWPYVCPEGCPRRQHCNFPKCGYRAEAAQRLYESRLAGSRGGVGITPNELEQAMSIVAPLVKQGQSFEAIWASHGDELPVCVRTFYTYVDRRVVDIASIELPRKVRYRPRKRKDRWPDRSRVDRSGRTYDDFKALPLKDQVMVVQADSVIGYEHNSQRILSLDLVRYCFQLYLLRPCGRPESVVSAFDEIELYLGSPEEFLAAMGIVLADRGAEFNDWEGMERSALVPGRRRCRVFYCDPMETNQKSRCERNHEELRRILPKGRSDFDLLTPSDVA